MRINDEGYLIQQRAFSENKLLLSFFTKEYGRVNGMARISRKNPVDLLYLCQIRWSAKLDHQLGFIEHNLMRAPPPSLMNDYTKLLAVQSISALLSTLLVEHHPYPTLFETVTTVYEALHGDRWLYAYMQFEKTLLEQLGFGLDLTQCASTGARDNLIYISPKSGRAVCSKAGEPYKDKLFPLPRFFKDPLATDAPEALHILRYFLTKNFFENKPLLVRQTLCDRINEKLNDIHYA
ncbi:MAG: DNA repair protein RecO [Alphaproteobacteria bacterium]|nr:DNA repair protein RecO [Alphaproteobacteria bacterium]